MSGEEASAKVEGVKAANADETEGRDRSTIGFPYNDLDSAVEMAQAIHNQVGAGDCDNDQLAAWTNQSPKSSGFRTQVSATRLFGLMETAGPNRYRLTNLGRMIVDPVRAREARARAFLQIPLYSAVYEKYRGGVIPPAAALERDMEGLGVAPKMKDRARRIFERAAEQGGYFESGRNRLVQPGFGARASDDPPPPPPPADKPDGGGKDVGGGGGGGRHLDLHPFIQGLLKTLPNPDDDEAKKWPAAQRVKWLQTAANIFDLIYEGEGGIEVRSAQAGRSPRPND